MIERSRLQHSKSSVFQNIRSVRSYERIVVYTVGLSGSFGFVMTTGVVLTFAACTRRHVLPARPLIGPPAEKARITRLDFETRPYVRAGQDQFPLGLY